MACDWDPEDLKAAIRKNGLTLAALGRRSGLDRRIIAHALVKPHARAERAIAEFLGLSSYAIWPSRYHSDGTRKRPQPTENYRRRARFNQQETVNAS